MGALELFLVMMCLHYLADFPLQGDFLSKAKDLTKPLPGVPWQQAMTAHCAIQGLMVWLVTGVWWIGVLEFMCHAAIDIGKCLGKINFSQDQSLHTACKIVWVVLVAVIGA